MSGTQRRELLSIVVASAVLTLVVGVFAAIATANDTDDRALAAAEGAVDGDDRDDVAAAVGQGDERGHAHGDDGLAVGTAEDAGHDHGHDGAHDAAHDDAHGHANGTTGTTHGNHDHSGDPTLTPATHGDHAHGPIVPGSTPTTHDPNHHHPPATVKPGSTTPTTHDSSHHHPPATTPGSTTPSTDPHHHEEKYAQIGDLPPEVQQQIATVTFWAMQAPTAKDAVRAGYPQLTKYFPGIAAHYINLGLLFDNKPFDWTKPEVLLYGAEGPDAPLVGINYIVKSGDTPPEGFAGDWDVWHEHQNLCLQGGIVVGEVPHGQQCPSGQQTFDFDGFWLLHVWSIPGWDSPEGIFSHENSRV